MLRKAHPKMSDGVFLAYVSFVLSNYFVVRWQHERLKWKVMKFKKLRRKVTNFDFGMPNPPNPPSPLGKSSSPAAPPKKSK